MKNKIYDHHRKHVGSVEFHKRNQTAEVKFHDGNHYADVTLDIEKWDEYKTGFGFKFEEELGQITLEDLL